MSDENRRAIEYLVRALSASVRDGQRELIGDSPVYSVGVILRRMRSDIGALAALLRETQKDAPVRRKRRKRKEEPATPPAVGSASPLPSPTPSVPRPPRQRIVVSPEPPVRTPPGVSE